jgi:hypothetical protein
MLRVATVSGWVALVIIWMILVAMKGGWVINLHNLWIGISPSGISASFVGGTLDAEPANRWSWRFGRSYGWSWRWSAWVQLPSIRTSRDYGLKVFIPLWALLFVWMLITIALWRLTRRSVPGAAKAFPI